MISMLRVRALIATLKLNGGTFWWMLFSEEILNCLMAYQLRDVLDLSNEVIAQTKDFC